MCGGAFGNCGGDAGAQLFEEYDSGEDLGLALRTKLARPLAFGGTPTPPAGSASIADDGFHFNTGTGPTRALDLRDVGVSVDGRLPCGLAQLTDNIGPTGITTVTIPLDMRAIDGRQWAIRLTRQTPVGSALGQLCAPQNEWSPTDGGVGMTITIKAVDPSDPSSVVTDDGSVVLWEAVRVS